MDGRGSVVPMQIGKGPKYRMISVRSHSTRDVTEELQQVYGATEESIRKDYQRYVKLWHNGYYKPNTVHHDLGGYLKLESIWITAAMKLFASKGSLSSGPDGKNVNYLNWKRISKVRKQVLDGTYVWGGTRRVWIPKPGQPGKSRPLGVPTIEDRLVQEVLRLLLEPIFEPSFAKTSHGFRPERGVGTALKDLNTRFKASTWYIEGDIKGYFDNIHHKLLMSLVRKKVQDQRVLKLLSNGLKSKIFEFKKAPDIPGKGVPQGGIISPLLSNIYLHELDVLMNDLCECYQGRTTAKNRKKNPLYNKLIRSGNKAEVRRNRVPRSDPWEKD